MGGWGQLYGSLGGKVSEAKPAKLCGAWIVFTVSILCDVVHIHGFIDPPE